MPHVWSPANEVIVDSPTGGVLPAIQSQPPGKPLLFGRTENYAGNPRFYPLAEEEALKFSGQSSAHVPDFWSNPEAFAFEVVISFADLNSDQTILLVTNVFDLRLSLDSGAPQLRLFAYRQASRPISVFYDDIEPGRNYVIRGGVRGAGELYLRLDERAEQSARLGQPLAEWNVYPDLFVGTANPTGYHRPFKGSLSSLKFLQGSH